jgi:hypothetical protein
MKHKTRFLLLLIALPVLLITLGSYALQGYIQNKALSSLKSFGLHSAQIDSIAYYPPYISFENIRLDQENFSSIDSIRMHMKGLIPFTNGTAEMIIDGLSLSGEIAFPYKLNIAGWQPPNRQNHIHNANIILNDARLDLMTPDGAVRLEAKGIVKTLPNGETTINGALWGVQHQLNIDTRWQGTVSQDGIQKYDVEILKGTLNLDYLSLSRLTGNATIQWPAEESLPSIDSTLAIGKFAIGGIPLTSTNIETSGKIGAQTVVIEGFIAGKNIMQTGIRFEQQEKTTQVQAAINARELEDLISFLNQVRTNVNQSTWGIGYFMPLMLTKGNLERIENDMKGIPYDELQLSVTGSLNDMTGKITAYQKNSAGGERHIISLDPGFSAP